MDAIINIQTFKVEAKMNAKLLLQTILKFLLGVVLVGLLVFLPAGTISFFNGWIFMAVLFVPMLVAGIVMM